MQGKSLKPCKTLALYPEDHIVYRPQSKQVSVFENENLFRFQGLNPDNDWVRLSKLIPWAELERRYAQKCCKKQLALCLSGKHGISRRNLPSN